jgi:hypothetical protein
VYRAIVTLDDGCFPKHDDKEWYIARNQGQWSAHGSFDTHRLCGDHVDFELPFHAAFAAPSKPPISLDTIRKNIPGAYDAFWSPGHEMAVVLIDQDDSSLRMQGEPWPKELFLGTFPNHTTLKVFSPRGQDMGKPFITIQLKEFEGPVMAEWATGSNVVRWTAELVKIKAQGVVKPLQSSSSRP